MLLTSVHLRTRVSTWVHFQILVIIGNLVMHLGQKIKSLSQNSTWRTGSGSQDLAPLSMVSALGTVEREVYTGLSN